jgi:hypothetical protein
MEAAAGRHDDVSLWTEPRQEDCCQLSAYSHLSAHHWLLEPDTHRRSEAIQTRLGHSALESALRSSPACDECGSENEICAWRAPPTHASRTYSLWGRPTGSSGPPPCHMPAGPSRLDVHFISSLPVRQRPACMAWAETRGVQIVGAESYTRPDHDVVDDACD